MTFWLWRLGRNEHPGPGDELSLTLTPSQVAGFRAGRGDVLLLVETSGVVAAAELLTPPSRAHDFDRALPQRIGARIIAGPLSSGGVGPSELGINSGVPALASGALILLESQGEKILAALRERAPAGRGGRAAKAAAGPLEPGQTPDRRSGVDCEPDRL